MSGFSRRDVLRRALSGGLAAPFVHVGVRTARGQVWLLYPFTLGVAAGDPAPDGFVIWTRLALDPLLARGGVRPTPIPIVWEVATDAAMTNVVRSGEAIARVEVGHSVHVEVDGLSPGREYFYRFRSGGADSAIGRARTLPAPGASVSRLRFAAAGCQQWEPGFFTAWKRIAEEDFDFVFHYGDYIYEYEFTKFDARNLPWPRTMPDAFPACVNLVDYRRRYGLYKTDPDLQAAHAACAFIPTFDDHEVVDNWSGDVAQDTPPEAFLFRRAAALQAWYEHMPVRRSLLPRGPDVLAYRAFQFGDLLTMPVLDTRQYRSKQPCDDGGKANCLEAEDPSRTMMGQAQEDWLARVLRESRAPWQALAQQVTFSQFDWQSFPWAKPGETDVHNMDSWDGAKAARKRVMAMLRSAPKPNPMVLSGDIHIGVAMEMREDWKDMASPCVGVEFVSTSISSGGDGSAQLANEATVLGANPHMKLISNRRGYTRHEVTPKFWRADYRALERISIADAPVTTLKSFVVEAGKPGLSDG